MPGSAEITAPAGRGLSLEGVALGPSWIDHICYQYNAPQNESLTIKDKQFQLSEYYDSAITSIFAQPTYKELDEAMDYYNTRYVRDSSCAVLSQIWTDEAKREFVQKPEHFMRDSLWQCLQNILRNHTVKREQINPGSIQTLSFRRRRRPFFRIVPDPAEERNCPAGSPKALPAAGLSYDAVPAHPAFGH